MSTGRKFDRFYQKGTLVTARRQPYSTRSGHVRYANKAQLKHLPIDFNAWVSVFEQDL